MVFFLQLLVNGLVIGSVYAMVALGFVLIYKASDVINFAQGELLLIGAFTCLTLVTGFQLPFWVALIISLAFSFLLGLMVERMVLRKFINKPIISVIMVTLGISSAMKGIMQMTWGTSTRTFPEIFPSEPVHLGDVVISQVYLWSLVISMILLLLFTIFFKYSTMGIAMRATADDQQAALSMGISVKVVFAAAWAISALVSAIGGIVLGNINGVNFSLSHIGLTVLPVAILGGLDSIPGAIIGGLLIGILENMAGGYIDPLVGGGAKVVAPYIILVLILMIKPYGLFGKQIIERV